VADAAQGIRAVADRVLLLPRVVRIWGLGADQWRAEGGRSCPSGAGADAGRGGSGQSDGEGDGGGRGPRVRSGPEGHRDREEAAHGHGYPGVAARRRGDRGGVGDPAGAKSLCRSLGPDRFPRRELVWADSKYHNYDLYDYMRGRVSWRIEVVSRPPDATGWVTLPRRWVVERTYAWIGRYRANSKDYERCNRSSEGMVYTSMTRLMLNRLSPGPPSHPFRYRKNSS
jgi:transposase